MQFSSLSLEQIFQRMEGECERFKKEMLWAEEHMQAHALKQHPNSRAWIQGLWRSGVSWFGDLDSNEFGILEMELNLLCDGTGPESRERQNSTASEQSVHAN